MNIDAVTYDFEAGTITVGWENGDSKTYAASDVEQFLADTGREDDVKTMGWSLPTQGAQE